MRSGVSVRQLAVVRAVLSSRSGGWMTVVVVTLIGRERVRGGESLKVATASPRLGDSIGKISLTLVFGAWKLDQ